MTEPADRGDPADARTGLRPTPGAPRGAVPRRGRGPGGGARRSGRRGGSTSSASTPTTTWVSYCPPRSTSRSGSRSSRPTTGRSSWSAIRPASGSHSHSTRSGRARAAWPPTSRGPRGRSPRPVSPPGGCAGSSALRCPRRPVLPRRLPSSSHPPGRWPSTPRRSRRSSWRRSASGPRTRTSG